MIEEWLKVYSKEVTDFNLDISEILSPQKMQVLNLLMICKLIYNNFKKMINHYDHKYNYQEC